MPTLLSQLLCALAAAGTRVHRRASACSRSPSTTASSSSAPPARSSRAARSRPCRAAQPVAARRRRSLFLGTVAPWEIHALGSGLQPLLGFDPASVTISPPARPRTRVRRLLGARPDLADRSCSQPTRCSPSCSLEQPAGAARGARRSGSPAAAPTCRRPVPPVLVLQPDARHPPRTARLPHPRSSQPAAGTPTRRRVLEPAWCLAIDRFLYRPLAAARRSPPAPRIRRLQSGRLSTYLLYMIIALILALALIPILR